MRFLVTGAGSLIGAHLAELLLTGDHEATAYGLDNSFGTAAQDEENTFLAPNYWMGFRAKRWFPHEGIGSGHLTFLGVELV
jgi:nucleoside-diphosphate-sugar epimerase